MERRALRGLARVRRRRAGGDGAGFHVSPNMERVVAFVNIDVGPAEELASVDVPGNGDAVRQTDREGSSTDREARRHEASPDAVSPLTIQLLTGEERAFGDGSDVGVKAACASCRFAA